MLEVAVVAVRGQSESGTRNVFLRLTPEPNVNIPSGLKNVYRGQ